VTERGLFFIRMWQTADQLVRSAQAREQFSISTRCFVNGWEPLDKFSPGSRPDKLKSGVGIPEMNEKDEPHTGY
jgi:hypothetical protein